MQKSPGCNIVECLITNNRQEIVLMDIVFFPVTCARRLGMCLLLNLIALDKYRPMLTTLPNAINALLKMMHIHCHSTMVRLVPAILNCSRRG